MKFLQRVFIYTTSDKITLLCIAAAVKLLTVLGIYAYDLYISEVMPTPIRSTSMSLIIVAGNFSRSAVPYIVHVSISTVC